MRKVKYYKCPVCGYKLKTLNGWISHMESHPNSIPNHMTPSQYFNFLITGKDNNKCVMCGKNTDWNEKSLKYNRFCNDPKCKQLAANIAKSNMKKVYGKEHLLNDPDVQKKMLKNRKISGTYTFKDGGELSYVGTYEKDFLEMMDTFLNWNSIDIEFPSPHVYKYMYEGTERFYIPDGYIGSLNLEIEIKQNTSTHPKIIAVDKEKEKLKDEVMNSIKDKVNYIKIVDKDYKPFFECVMNLRDSYEDSNHKTNKDIPYHVIDENDKMNKQGMKEKDVLTFINALQNKLATYDTGFKVENKKAKITSENLQKYYKTLEPSKFQSSKCGLCYDYTHFQFTTLTAAMIDSNCILIEIKDNKDKNSSNTFTFNVIPYRGKWVYMESCIEELKGVYLADTVEDIVANVINVVMKTTTFEEPVCDGYYVYKPDKTYYGINNIELFNKITGSCKKKSIYNLKSASKLEKVSK